MTQFRIDRKVFRAVLSGTYTPHELHAFVQLCYSLAVPVIRKKISLGKLNLDMLGLQERDIVQDCLADLFHREESKLFPEIVRFFDRRVSDVDNASDERLLMTLRQLLMGKVGNNIIRMYSEVDPVLGKILRNLSLGLERTHLFEKHARFGEAYLIVSGAEALSQFPPVPMDLVKTEFAAVARIQDTIPQMMRKLHQVLCETTTYQRTVPLVPVALMFKEVYVLGWEQEESQTELQGEADDVPTIIAGVCRRIEKEMYKTYVDTGKRSPEVFQCYMLALNESLRDLFVLGDLNDSTYFEYLMRQMPQLSKATYESEHRTAFEYMAKTAKDRTREELRKM